jgi:hypothetical protein
MQAVRWPDDAGNGDQAEVWSPWLPRNPLAGRVLRHLQGERADGKPCRHATAGGDQRPTAARAQRISAHMATRRACPVRRYRMGIVRHSDRRPAMVLATRCQRRARRCNRRAWRGLGLRRPAQNTTASAMSITSTRVNPTSRWSAASVLPVRSAPARATCAPRCAAGRRLSAEASAIGAPN